MPSARLAQLLRLVQLLLLRLVMVAVLLRLDTVVIAMLVTRIVVAIIIILSITTVTTTVGKETARAMQRLMADGKDGEYDNDRCQWRW